MKKFKKLHFFLIFLVLINFKLFDLNQCFAFSYEKATLAPRLGQSSDIASILNLIIQTSEQSVEMDQDLYQTLKNKIRFKLTVLLDSLMQVNPELLKDSWIVGESSDNPLLWDELAAFLQNQMALSVLRLASPFPRDDKVYISGREIKYFDTRWEGGAIVWSDSDRFVVFSSMISKSGIHKLSQETGYRVHYLYPPRFNSHIDTVFGVIDNLKVFLVDPDFYQKRKIEIDNIAEKEGYKVALVARGEVTLRPANLIRLRPDLYVMTQAPKTLANIAEVSGKTVDEVEQVIKSIEFTLEPFFHIYGIRCMGTHNFPIVDYLKGDENFSLEEIESLVLALKSFPEGLDVSDEQIEINEDLLNFYVNELLLKFVLSHAEGEIKNKRLKEIQANQERIGNTGAVLRISQILSNESLIASEEERLDLLFQSIAGSTPKKILVGDAALNIAA